MLHNTAIIPVFMPCLLLTAQVFTKLSATFTQSPLNALVPPSSSEDFAAFYCQHDTADIVSWEVNGTSSYFDVNITICTHLLPYGAPLHKLNIPIDQEYNLTAIVCLALFLDGSPTQSTEPAFLIIQEGARPIPVGFVVTPFSAYNMTQEFILAIGENAAFTCQHCQSDSIRWRLNGTLVRNKDSNISLSYSFNSQCGVFSLMITKIEHYNTTTVQCEAHVDTLFVLTEPVLLLVQGKLDPVYNLRRNSRKHELDIYTWESPFTLNVTNADPDIIYCIYIFPIPCSESIQKQTMFADTINDCSVTDTSYTLPKHLNQENLYQIEVLPRTNLETAMNGTQKVTYEDSFVHVIIKNNNNMLYSINRGSIIFEIMFTFQLQNVHDGVKPNDISLQLMSIDNTVMTASQCLTMLDLRKLNTHNGTVFNYTEVLNCSAIEIRRLYMVTLFAYRAGCNISDAFELSTHLIDNIDVSLTFQPGEILISGNFITPSGTEEDIGFLAVVYTNLDDDPNLHYGIARRPAVKLQAEAFVSTLMEYEYRVSVFSLQNVGLPLNRSVSTAKKISNITAGNSSANYPNLGLHGSTNITALATLENDCLRLTCKFMEDSASQCVAVVSEKHQIASEYGLISIGVYNFVREGDTAKGCLPVDVNTVSHLIDVFTFYDNMISGVPTHINKIDTNHPVDNMIQRLIIGILIGGLVTLSLAIILIAGLKYTLRHKLHYKRKRILPSIQ